MIELRELEYIIGLLELNRDNYYIYFLKIRDLIHYLINNLDRLSEKEIKKLRLLIYRFEIIKSLMEEKEHSR